MTRLVASGVIDMAAPAQAGMRQRKALLGDFEQITVPDPCLEAKPRHVITQQLTLARAPGSDHVPRAIEAEIVVQKSDPERGQGRKPPPRRAVGAAHFQITLQPYFRKNRREVVGPVRQRRTLAGKRRIFSLEEIAER